MIHVERLEKNRRGIRSFLDLPYRLYRKDANWTPPMYDELRRTLLGENNPLLTGEHRFFLAFDDGQPVARVLAGVDERLNKRLGEKRGYLSLFESENNMEYARAVLDAASEYLKGLGMDWAVGPNTPMFNDFSKGLLAEGFDGAPMIFNPYNPSYYNDFFIEYGFEKHRDHYAYHLDLRDFPIADYRQLTQRAAKRFRFRVECVDLHRADKERLAGEIAQVIDEAFPEGWELVPPTQQDIHAEMTSLMAYASSATTVMAYADERPIGILTAFPDFNPLIRKSGGRLFPFGWLTMLFGRRRVRAARCNMLFVTPDYQNKAVGVALVLAAYENAMRLGLREVEASTIDETNVRSVLNTERTGAKRYRVYRQYRKRL